MSKVRRTFLDHTFWHESEAIVSLLKPLQSAITQLEEDSPNFADVCRLFFNFKYEILESIDSFPFILSEQEEIKSTIEVREDFSIKIIHQAAYFLNPQEQGRLLNDDDRVAAMEFVCELVEKLFCKMLDVSASKISEECALYSAKKNLLKRCFMEECFCYFPNCLVEWVLWPQRTKKIACKILRLSATSAAVERSFSCYTQMSTQLNEIDYLMKERQKLYLFPKT